jgi:hypothetical protein
MQNAAPVAGRVRLSGSRRCQLAARQPAQLADIGGLSMRADMESRDRGVVAPSPNTNARHQCAEREGRGSGVWQVLKGGKGFNIFFR